MAEFTSASFLEHLGPTDHWKRVGENGVLLPWTEYMQYSIHSLDPSFYGGGDTSVIVIALTTQSNIQKPLIKCLLNE